MKKSRIFTRRGDNQFNASNPDVAGYVATEVDIPADAKKLQFICSNNRNVDSFPVKFEKGSIKLFKNDFLDKKMPEEKWFHVVYW